MTNPAIQLRDLWTYADDIAEWETRVETEYEVLRAFTRERDIADEAFVDHFQPDNAVLTPVRLREATPTVEWRAPDTALPSQIIQLVSDVAALLRQTEDKDVIIGDGDIGVSDGSITIPRFADLRKLSASAIADGLTSEAVRTYLIALGFDLSNYQPISEQIEHGVSITDDEARTLRLQYAEQLEADVNSLR